MTLNNYNIINVLIVYSIYLINIVFCLKVEINLTKILMLYYS